MSNNGLKLAGITIISYTELLDRLNYYGLQSVLILYLTKQFGLLDKQSFEIFGVYAALPFGLSVIGGAIADRKLGFYYSAMLGCILIILGNFILTIQNLEFLYFGLATMMMGVGLLKPNNPNLLGEFNKDSSKQRERVYSYFYLCINLGAILGPVFYGIFSQQINYQICFILIGVLMSSGLIFLFHIKKNYSSQNISINQILQSICLISFFIVVAYFIFHFSRHFGLIMLCGLIACGIFVIELLKNGTYEERKSALYMLIPIVACILIFASLQQIYSSLIVFVDKYVIKEVLGWKIPTSWFSAIEPCCIFLMAPILNLIWKSSDTIHEKKIAIGLIAASFSFVLFSMSAFFSQKIPALTFNLIFVGNIFLAIGELCTIPVVISLINLLAPKKLKGTYMGVFYFSLTLSGYLSGLMAREASNDNQVTGYIEFFLFLSVILLISGMIVYAFSIIRKNNSISFNN